MTAHYRALSVALLALTPLGVRGQQSAAPIPKEFASLTGVVADSIRGGALTGALVTVAGTTRSATTDAQGAFRIDSIVPGTHSIIVTHPLLDTLGLQVHSAPFTLNGGERLQVGASTPSFDDVRAASCPRGGASYGPSILIGRVKKADSGEPAAGAAVSLVFKNLNASASPERVRTGRVDATGLFAICGLPVRFSGNVQATFGGVTTADLPVGLNNEMVATAMLSVGAAGGGRAVLKGRVTTKAGTPVAGAQVALVGTPAVATTAVDGTFALRGLPLGTQQAVVRKIGFAQASQVVTLSAADSTTVAVILGDAQVLKAVKVEGKLDNGLAKVGFTGRQQRGMGWYVTPDQIERRNPLLTTDMLRSAGGLRVVNEANGQFLEAMRGANGTSDACLNIFIDHARFDQEKPGDVDVAMPTTDLGAVEFYPSPSSTPAEFSVAGTQCATLVIWSKTVLIRQKP